MATRRAFRTRLVFEEENRKKSRKFGDVTEEQIILDAMRKQKESIREGEEDPWLELKAMRVSFRRRIKRLKKRLKRGKFSRKERSKIERQIEYMESILAIYPKKLLKLITVAAMLRKLRQKPEFLAGAAKLHVIHRRYGRKPIENAKKHVKN